MPYCRSGRHLQRPRMEKVPKVARVQSTYPNEMAEEREFCTVCGKNLGLSRRHPCGHQFHDRCLMWWMAQNGSYPACRRAVSAPPPMNQQPPASPGSTTTSDLAEVLVFYGCHSSPSNSVRHDSQLTGMAHQVNEVFPQIIIKTIIEDLRVSGSTQATIENNLEGRIGFIAGILGNEDGEQT
ncbi:CUE domain protein [Ancylostoma duodenale]|uniref:CUE domain protein n=1 Tax=Ancylostoma duodenale TaxID=51022 RepID=A0A0C2H539_9BILA|nr:CUE domain protein [Ancylostoma duodenale]